MVTLKVILLAIGILGLALFGMALKTIFSKDKTFTGGSCQSHPDALKDKGVSCGCGGEDACSTDEKIAEDLPNLSVKRYT